MNYLSARYSFHFPFGRKSNKKQHLVIFGVVLNYFFSEIVPTRQEKIKNGKIIRKTYILCPLFFIASVGNTQPLSTVRVRTPLPTFITLSDNVPAS